MIPTAKNPASLVTHHRASVSAMSRTERAMVQARGLVGWERRARGRSAYNQRRTLLPLLAWLAYGIRYVRIIYGSLNRPVASVTRRVTPLLYAQIISTSQPLNRSE